MCEIEEKGLELRLEDGVTAASVYGTSCPKCGSDDVVYATPAFVKGLSTNPLIPIFEICFGLGRMKHYFLCRSCGGDAVGRMFHLCPKCGALHEKMFFEGLSAELFNWLGVFCPHCEGQMAAEFAPATRAILFLTKPLWYLPSLLLRYPLRCFHDYKFGRLFAEAKIGADGKSRYLLCDAAQVESYYRWMGLSSGLLQSTVLYAILFFIVKPAFMQEFSLFVALCFVIGGLIMGVLLQHIMRREFNLLGEGKKDSGE